MFANSSSYDWSWVHCNVNCISRRMISLVSGALVFHSDWFEGYTVFSPTPPPLASLRPSTSTIGDT